MKAYTLKYINHLAEQAIDSACITIQHGLFNDATGDGIKQDWGVAHMFFSSEKKDIVKKILIDYITTEIELAQPIE